MSLPSVHSLQKKETKKGMLMFISMPWTMATGTASGPEQRAMAAREMSEEPVRKRGLGRKWSPLWKEGRGDSKNHNPKIHFLRNH